MCVRACAKGNRLLQMEKKIVISKLARLDAPDFMSNECVFAWL